MVRAIEAVPVSLDLLVSGHLVGPEGIEPSTFGLKPVTARDPHDPEGPFDALIRRFSH